MKKITLILTIFCTLQASSQPYLIDFFGYGASSTIDSIIVDNLTSGLSMTIKGDDYLQLTYVDAISETDISPSGISIYPNPMNDQTTLSIEAPVAGDATISIYNITGQEIIHLNTYLENYIQNFTLKGLNNGLYLVSIKGNTYQYSEKLFAYGASTGEVSIESSGDKPLKVLKKKSSKNSNVALATIDMPYTDGDILMYTAISGIYTSIKTSIPVEDETVFLNFADCADGDGNNYPIVEINGFFWTAKNLNTTKFNNGEDIVSIPDSIEWDTAGLRETPVYADYRNNPENSTIYGRLYNWYVAVDERNVCPVGWHVPSDAEFTDLGSYLGSDDVAGGKMKETGTLYWTDPNIGATNETGFAALPAGWRESSGGYNYIGLRAYFWSTTENILSPADKWYRRIHNDATYFKRSDYNGRIGLSIRCVMDY